MNYNININQKAIALLNGSLHQKLDLKDATILEWMLKFHAEPKSKKLMIGEQIYFWGAYALIIRENPLLEITDKDTLAIRIAKLISAGLIVKHLSKDKGNRTYFSVTQKCFDLITRGSDTLPSQNREGVLSKQGSLPCFDRYNNNIIDNINNSNKEDLGVKLFDNKLLHEDIAMKSHVKLEEVVGEIPLFLQRCEMLNIKHNNNTHLFNDFSKWVQGQFAGQKVKEQVKWYVKTFNTIANTNFENTSQIESMFRDRMLEGKFSGDSIIKSIKNLRSSDDRNWHKANGYVHATPEHLLKQGNLNKYANQKF